MLRCVHERPRDSEWAYKLVIPLPLLFFDTMEQTVN